jgi:hypothetical protein
MEVKLRQAPLGGLAFVPPLSFLSCDARESTISKPASPNTIQFLAPRNIGSVMAAGRLVGIIKRVDERLP